ncbi:MAG: PAS domain S-box protein, partial [Candidatus Saliniplasma sp.]
MEGSIKVLHVDDELDFLEVSKVFLQREEESLDVTTVQTPKRALELLEKEDFDVIVSDYQMPDMDGLELLEEIRNEKGIDIPFIMFTGKGREEVAIKSINLGANRYLQKGGEPKSQYGVLVDAIKQEVLHHRSEKKRIQYTHELKFLNEVMINVARMKNVDEICDHIADKVHSLNHENYVIVALYDREIDAIRVRSFAGSDEYQQMIEEQFVSGEEKITFDPEVLDEWGEIYRSGNLELMPEGLYSLVKGVLSKEESKELEGLFGVKEVYSVGFSLEEKPYGGISILKPEKGEPRFKSAIETIASQLAVILHKKQDEKRQRLSDFSLENASLEIYWIRPDGEFIFTNETVTERLGYSKEELRDMHIWDIDPNHDQDIRGERWEMLKEEGTLSFESKHETKDGEVYPVEINSSYLEFDGKEYEFAFAEDITERKKAQQRLKESEESYRTLFNSIRDAILVTDTDRDIIDCNPAFVDLFGYELEEIEGKQTEHVYHDVEQFEEMGEEIKKHMGEYDFYFTIDYEKKSGEVFPGETKVFYLRDDQGEISGFIGVIRDITERKRREKELREERNFIEQIAETSPVCITKVDRDGNITYANERAEDVLGLSKSEIKGRTYYDVDWKITDYEEKPFPKEELPFDLVKEKGELVYDVRHAIEWPGGERKLLSINAAPLYDEEGEFDGVVATIDDVTEEVEKERELEETKNWLYEIIHEASVPTFVIDKDHKITDWNRACEELTGLTGEEMVGTDEPWKAFYDDDRPVLADMVLEDASLEEIERYYGEKVKESSLIHGAYDGEDLFEMKGEDIWIYFTASPIKDSEGNIIGAIETLQDTTERKEKEEKLKESEQRYRRLFETAQDGMIIIDAASGEIIDANPFIKDMLGYSLDELRGKKLWEIGTFKDIVENKEKFDKLREEEYVRYEHLPLETKDGEEKSVEFVSNLYMVGDEEIIQCNIRDITERKEMEKKIKRERDRAQKYLDTAEVMMVTIDPEGEVIQANRKACEVLGCEQEEIMGEDWFENFIPEERREELRKIHEGYIEKRETVEEYYENSVITKDGEEKVIEWRNNIISDEDGDVIGTLSSGQDITDRKEKEQVLERERKKFRAIFNNFNDAIYLHELNEDGTPGKFIEVNHVATEMLGYTREEFLKMSPKDIDAGEHAEKVPAVMKELVETGDIRFEMTHKAKDGTKVPVEIHSHVFELEGEKRVLSVVRDITERKEAEEKLKKSERKFRKSFDASPDPMFLLDEEGVFK